MERAVIMCEECGGERPYHRLTYITVALDDVLRPLFTPGPMMRFFSRWLYAIEARFTPHLFDFLVRIGAAKKQERHDEATALLAQMLWNEADARGITVWEFRLFHLPRNVFVAEFPSGRKIAYEGIPMPPSGIELAWWTDNKAEMKKRFMRLGLPVARGGEAFTFSGALRIFRSLEAPVIIKPHSGSGSRHTFLHITDEQELERAFRSAKQVSPFVVVEEEFRGPVYRATVVDGVFAAALRRDPPHIIGDGARTIAELVEEANTHPARGGPYFSQITLGPNAEKELAWQELTVESIPEQGRRVLLHQKVNWSVGGTTEDETSIVHPDNIALFERVADVLHAPIVGIDFIIEDMSRSWKEQERCGIIECNSMPFFDNHHLPFKGEPRNVAGAIWDMVENPF